MLTERDAIEQIQRGNLRLLPLHIELVNDTQPQKILDAVVAIMWNGSKQLFAAEYKARSTPKEFATAVDQVRRVSQASGLYPLILMPYLNERQLNELAELQISGIDFCGNGVVMIPNQLLVFRSGKPNLFPASAPIKNIYRKNSSLVSRAFLAQPVFESVGAIEAFIQMHGGHEEAISLSTVSKALRVLEDDLIVSRANDSIRLVQPEKLLDKLTTNFARTVARHFLVGKSPYGAEALKSALVGNAFRCQLKIAATGVGSTSHYAVMAHTAPLSIYCTDQYRLMAGIEFQETTRFPNLEVFETLDKTAYFNTRPGQGFEWASPLQSYLELMAGDQRERDTAQQVRELILKEIKERSNHGAA